MKEGAAEALDKARELCKEGKYRSADQVFRKDILPPGSIAGDYQQGGLLQVEFQGLPAPAPFRPGAALRWTCSIRTRPPGLTHGPMAGS